MNSIVIFIVIISNALQEKRAIVAGFLRRVRKLPLYIAYCGVPLERRNSFSLLRHTTAVVYKIAAIYVF